MCFAGPGYSTRVAFYADWIAHHLNSTFGKCQGWNVETSFSAWPVAAWPRSSEYQTSRCSEGFWQCGSGECIPSSNVCDGTPHCSDESDENYVSSKGIALCAGQTSNRVNSNSLATDRFLIIPSPLFDSTVIIPPLKQSLKIVYPDCTAMISNVNQGIASVQQSQNVVGDIHWNSQPLVTACAGFNMCQNKTSNPSSYGWVLQFCKSLTDFVNFNETRAALISAFSSQFGEPACAIPSYTTLAPQTTSGPGTSSSSAATTTVTTELTTATTTGGPTSAVTSTTGRSSESTQTGTQEVTTTTTASNGDIGRKYFWICLVSSIVGILVL